MSETDQQPVEESGQVTESAAPSRQPADTGASNPVCKGFPAWADKHRWWLFTGILLIYLAGFNGQWRLNPDSAVYVGFARQVATGNGLTLEQRPVSKANLMVVYLTAASFRVFGVDRFVASHVIMLLITGIALTSTYWWLKLSCSRPTAVIVTCIVGLTENVYNFGFELLADMPFFAGVMLFLVAYELIRKDRRSMVIGLILAVPATLIMAWSRSVVLTFAAAVLLDTLIQLIRGPWRIRSIGLALIMAATLLGARSVDPTLVDETLSSDEQHVVRKLGAQLPSTLERSSNTTLGRLMTETTPEAAFAVDTGNVPGVILSLAIIAAGISLVTRRRLWAIVIVAFFCQWVLFVTTVRYFLPIMPLLALGWWCAAGWLRRQLAGGGGLPLGIVLISMWVAPNVFYVGKFIYTQRYDPFYNSYERGKYANIHEMSRKIQSIVGPEDIVISENVSVLRYFSGRKIVGLGRMGRGARRQQYFDRFASAKRLWLVKPINKSMQQRLKLLPVKLGQEVFTAKTERGLVLSLYELIVTGPFEPPKDSESRNSRRRTRSRKQVPEDQ